MFIGTTSYEWSNSEGKSHQNMKYRSNQVMNKIGRISLLKISPNRGPEQDLLPNLTVAFFKSEHLRKRLTRIDITIFFFAFSNHWILRIFAWPKRSVNRSSTYEIPMSDSTDKAFAEERLLNAIQTIIDLSVQEQVRPPGTSLASSKFRWPKKVDSILLLLPKILLMTILLNLPHFQP